ncbi:lycopene cyclase domain-containing protein [Agromyces lapidis]|uniref:Lycopene cyclase domain-containing protein n=1 Tax=Agromyces lapidis TaxID=279574 RepID=A0ABV5SU72_9MICO|nr:lycopene cyclase domain-containing protein [Agromyces lapidis]
MSYALLSLPFLAVAALVAALGWRRAPRGHLRALVLTAIALVVLTAVFDTIMIATGLFGYSDARIWGVRIGLAPIEDFAYPIAGVLLLSGLWNLLAPTEADHAD